MTTTALGSILVGSTDPDRLRTWYRAAFASDQPDEGPLNVGGVLLVFEKRTDVAHTNPEPEPARKPRLPCSKTPGAISRASVTMPTIARTPCGERLA